MSDNKITDDIRISYLAEIEKISVKNYREKIDKEIIEVNKIAIKNKYYADIFKNTLKNYHIGEISINGRS